MREISWEVDIQKLEVLYTCSMSVQCFGQVLRHLLLNDLKEHILTLSMRENGYLLSYKPNRKPGILTRHLSAHFFQSKQKQMGNPLFKKKRIVIIFERIDLPMQKRSKD